MAAIWDLPVVYVVENNLYGASTPVSTVDEGRAHRRAGRAPTASPASTVDGNDVLAVYEAAREAVARARAGKGPTLLELVTYRITGHSRRDPCLVPARGRAEAGAGANEPIGRFAKRLLADKVADAGPAGRDCAPR